MFGLFKKKALTLEQQIETLRQLGFRFSEGFTSESALREFSAPEFEKDPYTLLLVYLGGQDHDEASGQWSCRSNQIWHFDFECIEDNGAYVAIAERMVALADGQLPLTAISDEVDIEEEKAILRFELDGQPIEYKLKVDNDWADPDVFYRLFALARGRPGDKCFTYLPLGQDCLIGFASEAERQALYEATGLDFQWLNAANL